MIITKNEGILRELKNNYIRDAEERMERGREIGLNIKRGVERDKDNKV
jgi:hypothetical protein